MTTRSCRKCGLEKPLEEFVKNPSCKPGVSKLCKKCKSEINKQHYEDNKEKTRKRSKQHYEKNKNTKEYKERHKRHYENNKKKYKERQKRYYENNKEKILAKQKEWRYKNKEKMKKILKEYYEKNKEKINIVKKVYNKRRMKEDVGYKLKCHLRKRLRRALKNNYKSGSAVRDLGCTVPELKAHLESQFQPGMTWENHGRNGWHIDHIKPLSLFDLTDREQLLEACHYTNLQPLWQKDNLSKGSKYEDA